MEECQSILAKWPDIFTYEGAAYSAGLAPAPGMDQPLYRFYNRNTGTHFYTASGAERDQVLSRWADVFSYEGVAYYVGAGGQGQVPLYRFYNRGTGAHFYTASETERDSVLARWSGTFTYEDPAFYVR